MSKQPSSSSTCLVKQLFIPMLLVVCAGIISFTMHLQTEKLNEQQLALQRSDKKLSRLSNDIRNLQSQIVNLRTSSNQKEAQLHKEIRQIKEQLQNIEASNEQILSNTNEAAPRQLIIGDDKVSVNVGPAKDQETRFGGIGVMLRYLDDGFKIEKVIEPSPAKKKGLYAGDIITEIEDQPISQMTKEEALSSLRGPEGSRVRITVKPSGTLNTTKRYNLVREIIDISEIKAD